MAIEFDGHRLELYQPHGMQGNYHVMIDGYYKGSIYYTTLGWIASVRTEVLDGNDIGELVEMIQKETL